MGLVRVVHVNGPATDVPEFMHPCVCTCKQTCMNVWSMRVCLGVHVHVYTCVRVLYSLRGERGETGSDAYRSVCDGFCTNRS